MGKPSTPQEFRTMPEIQIQQQCAQLSDLVKCESFGAPEGPLPLQTDKGFFKGTFGPSELVAGTWECEPGILHLDLEVTEFCHLLAGHWVFTSESGQVDEVRAGDSWVFPAGWKGKAEVRETVRKVYLMVIPSG
jgi:uncharacterized cupin superfamily protein